MPTSTLLLSRFPVKPGFATKMIEALGESADTQVLASMEADEVLQLRALPDTLTLAETEALLSPEAGQFAPYLAGDVRRELLSYVEAPKPCAGVLPDTPYIQLRHVEVKPEQQAAYRTWRDETIFEVVRGHDAAEVFLAYHSVISSQPGVMFVAGFSSAPEDYTSAFTSEHYAEIVRQAGDTYITGGTDGLYTKIYCTPTALAA
ncbi:hypothetical protein C8N32_11412 [Rhodovulum imhoffii]|uniref:EthD domain-containing protein n=1 Tax=Rhodovulum imhoffii TaxID=365340 RepID=A0A2T5BQA4_9RHOB|nr:hypothetical protein [Rhodovulum imhoffii]MBK5933703.1 hypothetical protein [Rhodovulum imhoffii]PTN01313.1 hypothetical protein C8N32_11412 [Rhodovulum imhoffii]